MAIGIGLVAGAWCVPVTSAADSDACISADLDRSVRLPHGEVFPAGRLTVCHGAMSPVAYAHRTYFDGQPVAVLQSKTTPSEIDDDAAPEMVFEVGFDGRLEFVGYVVPGRGHSMAFRFVTPRVRTADSLAAATRLGDEVDALLMAAVGD